jgi:translation initiation factor 5B
MPPKKKANKKADDDWEAELGESIAPASSDPDPAKTGNEDEEPTAGGGGLMALMKKNKDKRKKKGLDVDFVEGEDAPGADLAGKTPEEATMDDEFALPGKKGKGAKGKQQPAKPATEDAGDGDESGKVLTKAEKEKLKKEKEKQRKKEQVSDSLVAIKLHLNPLDYLC